MRCDVMRIIKNNSFFYETRMGQKIVLNLSPEIMTTIETRDENRRRLIRTTRL